MWTALEIPGMQAAIDLENRQQIMASRHRRPSRGDDGVPREAPARVPQRLTQTRAIGVASASIVASEPAVIVDGGLDRVVAGHEVALAHRAAVIGSSLHAQRRRRSGSGCGTGSPTAG